VEVGPDWVEYDLANREEVEKLGPEQGDYITSDSVKPTEYLYGDELMKYFGQWILDYQTGGSKADFDSELETMRADEWYERYEHHIWEELYDPEEDPYFEDEEDLFSEESFYDTPEPRRLFIPVEILERHEGPIHPGTGTDQSVHSPTGEAAAPEGGGSEGDIRMVYEGYFGSEFPVAVRLEEWDEDEEEWAVEVLSGPEYGTSHFIGLDDLEEPDELELETWTSTDADATETRAVEIFGLTDDVSEAGFLLGNGDMLDFSERAQGGPGGMRTLDHRAVTEALLDDQGPQEDTGSDSPGMIFFMEHTGAIRLQKSSGWFAVDMHTKPTSAQWSVILDQLAITEDWAVDMTDPETGEIFWSEAGTSEDLLEDDRIVREMKAQAAMRLRTFEMRHGVHEQQQGRPGQSGGSQPGYKHVAGSLEGSAFGYFTPMSDESDLARLKEISESMKARRQEMLDQASAGTMTDEQVKELYRLDMTESALAVATYNMPEYSSLIVYDEEGEVAGAVAIHDRRRMRVKSRVEEGREFPALELVYMGTLRPGYGEPLLFEAIQMAASQGAGIVLEAIPSAREFYGQFGLKGSGVRENGFETFELFPEDVLPFVRRHEAPIHPGTGTDQSVHAGGKLGIGEIRERLTDYMQDNWEEIDQAFGAGWMDRQGRLYSIDSVQSGEIDTHWLSALTAIDESGIWSKKELQQAREITSHELQPPDFLIEHGFVRWRVHGMSDTFVVEISDQRTLSRQQKAKLQTEAASFFNRNWRVEIHPVFARMGEPDYYQGQQTREFLGLTERHNAPIHPGTGTDQSVHAGDTMVAEEELPDAFTFLGRRRLRKKYEELADFLADKMKEKSELESNVIFPFDPNVIGSHSTIRVLIDPDGRVYHVRDHDPATDLLWKFAQAEGLVPKLDNVAAQLGPIAEEVGGYEFAMAKDVMLVLGFSRGTIQGNIGSFEVVEPVSRSTKKAILRMIERVEIEAIRPEFYLDVNTRLEGIGVDDVPDADSFLGDRAVKAWLTRHFKEIHPGTGTDQSVHADGGGKPEAGKGKKGTYISASKDLAEPGTTASDMNIRDIKQASGASIRGTVISLDDPRIPETVYHMTTALSAVEDSRELSAAGKGGLGGDDRDEIVSLTINEQIAKQLVLDMQLAAVVSKEFGPTEPEWKYIGGGERIPIDPQTGEEMTREEAIEWSRSLLKRINQLDQNTPDWDFRGGPVNMFADEVEFDPGYAVSDWLTSFFVHRESDNRELKNPLLYGTTEEMGQLDPEEIGYFAIPKENLDTGALVTDFDLGRGSLEEIRVYGDVPLTQPIGVGGKEVWNAHTKFGMIIPEPPPPHTASLANRGLLYRGVRGELVEDIVKNGLDPEDGQSWFGNNKAVYMSDDMDLAGSYAVMRAIDSLPEEIDIEEPITVGAVFVIDVKDPSLLQSDTNQGEGNFLTFDKIPPDWIVGYHEADVVPGDYFGVQSQDDLEAIIDYSGLIERAARLYVGVAFDLSTPEVKRSAPFASRHFKEIHPGTGTDQSVHSGGGGGGGGEGATEVSPGLRVALSPLSSEALERIIEGISPSVAAALTPVASSPHAAIFQRPDGTFIMISADIDGTVLYEGDEWPNRFRDSMEIISTPLNVGEAARAKAEGASDFVPLSRKELSESGHILIKVDQAVKLIVSHGQGETGFRHGFSTHDWMETLRYDTVLDIQRMGHSEELHPSQKAALKNLIDSIVYEADQGNINYHALAFMHESFENAGEVVAASPEEKELAGRQVIIDLREFSFQMGDSGDTIGWDTRGNPITEWDSGFDYLTEGLPEHQARMVQQGWAEALERPRFNTALQYYPQDEERTSANTGLSPGIIAALTRNARLPDEAHRQLTFKLLERADTIGTAENTYLGLSRRALLHEVLRSDPRPWTPQRAHGSDTIETTADEINNGWQSTTATAESILFSEIVAEKFGGESIPRERSIGGGTEWKWEDEAYREDVAILVDQIHADTQAQLEAAGYEPGDTIRMYRGMEYRGEEAQEQWNPDGVNSGPARVDMWSTSSWTTATEIAARFASSHDKSNLGWIVAADIPIERLLCNSSTGPPCQSEAEWIVIGDPDGTEGAIVRQSKLRDTYVVVQDEKGNDLAYPYYAQALDYLLTGDEGLGRESAALIAEKRKEEEAALAESSMVERAEAVIMPDEGHYNWIAELLDRRGLTKDEADAKHQDELHAYYEGEPLGWIVPPEDQIDLRKRLIRGGSPPNLGWDPEDILQRHYAEIHPGTGTDQSVHGGGGGGGEGSRLGPETVGDRARQLQATAGVAAANMVLDAQRAEPENTAMIKELASTYGGEMTGLEHAVKTEESLTRKIINDVIEKGLPPEEAAKEINDVNRYTMIFDPENYTEQVNQVVRDLEERGWSKYDEKWKNFFGTGDAYDGLNMVMVNDQGQKFEIQFHTPESVEIKDKAHDVFDEYRELRPNDPERKTLYDEMAALWVGYQKPANWEQLPGRLLGEPANATQRSRIGAMRYFAREISNPESDKYLELVSLHRFEVGYDFVVSERWDPERRLWVDDPDLIAFTGIGGADDFVELNEMEAREQLDKLRMTERHMGPGNHPSGSPQSVHNPHKGSTGPDPYNVRDRAQKWNPGADNVIEYTHRALDQEIDMTEERKLFEQVVSDTLREIWVMTGIKPKNMIITNSYFTLAESMEDELRAQHYTIEELARYLRNRASNVRGSHNKNTIWLNTRNKMVDDELEQRLTAQTLNHEIGHAVHKELMDEIQYTDSLSYEDYINRSITPTQSYRAWADVQYRPEKIHGEYIADLFAVMSFDWGNNAPVFSRWHSKLNEQELEDLDTLRSIFEEATLDNPEIARQGPESEETVLIINELEIYPMTREEYERSKPAPKETDVFDPKAPPTIPDTVQKAIKDVVSAFGDLFSL
jgi:hypothetical protein